MLINVCDRCGKRTKEFAEITITQKESFWYIDNKKFLVCKECKSEIQKEIQKYRE